MGYAICMGNCICCKQVFSFNPHKVPSIRIDGIREPICQSCIVLINDKRKAIGVKPLAINPDAYEAIDEEEL